MIFLFQFVLLEETTALEAKYQSLGPKDHRTGKVVGGRHLLFGSIELEEQLDKLGSASFL